MPHRQRSSRGVLFRSVQVKQSGNRVQKATSTHSPHYRHTPTSTLTDCSLLQVMSYYTYAAGNPGQGSADNTGKPIRSIAESNPRLSAILFCARRLLTSVVSASWSDHSAQPNSLGFNEWAPRSVKSVGPLPDNKAFLWRLTILDIEAMLSRLPNSGRIQSPGILLHSALPHECPVRCFFNWNIGSSSSLRNFCGISAVRLGSRIARRAGILLLSSW